MMQAATEEARPVRIQRKRTKGWRMPENTISVDRSTKWGNLFVVNPHAKAGTKLNSWYINVPTLEDAVECFRLYIKYRPDLQAAARRELRGKNLACFCALDQKCHADVWLVVANAGV